MATGPSLRQSKVRRRGQEEFRTSEPQLLITGQVWRKEDQEECWGRDNTLLPITARGLWGRSTNLVIEGKVENRVTDILG